MSYNRPDSHSRLGLPLPARTRCRTRQPLALLLGLVACGTVACGTVDRRIDPDAPDEVGGAVLDSQDIRTMADTMARDIPGLSAGVGDWVVSANGSIVVARRDDGRLVYWQSRSPDAMARDIPGLSAGRRAWKLSADGSTLYINFNGHAADRLRPAAMKPNGFGLCAFAQIEIPAAKR